MRRGMVMIDWLDRNQLKNIQVKDSVTNYYYDYLCAQQQGSLSMLVY